MNKICLSILSNIFSCQKRSFKTTPALQLFFESDPKGGYKTKRELPPFKHRIQDGFKELKHEIALWKNEVKEHFDWDPLLDFRPGEVDVIWKFEGEKSLETWIVTCDKDHNEGFSNCSLTTNKQGKALFSGNLETRVPIDGRVKRSGYCNIKTQRARKSFKRVAYLDWTAYNMLVMKVRGDGRNYMLNIHTRGYFDVTWNDIYSFVLYTRGGPYWQIAKIPLSKFYLSNKGRIQDRQESLTLNKITEFGITAARYPGTFSLEVDYIGLEFDPNHTEEFAYEMYETQPFIAAH